MYNEKKGKKDIFYKFGKIGWNRYFMEVQNPWSLLNAFAMGLAAIKNFYIIHDKE